MNPPLAKTYEEYLQGSYYYRGMFIDKFCNLELEIERCIGSAFFDNSPDRRYFKNIILDRLTFEAKRTALRALLQHKTPDINYKKLFDEISQLSNKRNHFAHYYLTSNPIGVPYTYVIGLADYRDGKDIVKDVIIYDSERFERAISRVESVIEQLKQIRKEIFQP
jgi:hypothetical protein